MKTVEFEGVQHQFPDDFTDADITEALGSLSAPPPGTVTVKAHTRRPRGSLRQGLGVALQAMRPEVEAAINALPLIGGIAGQRAGEALGSVGGPPGVIAGEAGFGGLGQGLGAAAQQGALAALGLPGAPETPSQALDRIKTQAAWGTLSGPAGRVIGAGLRGAGGLFMKAATGGDAAAASTALAERVSLGRGGRAALKAQMDALDAQAGQLAKATRMRIPGDRLTSALDEPIKAAIASSEPRLAFQLGQMRASLRAFNTNGFSPARLFTIARSAEKAAERAAEGSPRAIYNKAIGDRARDLLHTVVGGFSDVDTRLAQLKGVDAAVSRRESQTFAQRALPRVGTALAGGLIGGSMGGEDVAGKLRGGLIGAGAGALANPGPMSNLALLLTDPRIVGAIQAIGRIGGYASP